MGLVQLFQSHDQRKEALLFIELEKMFQTFENSSLLDFVAESES